MVKWLIALIISAGLLGTYVYSTTDWQLVKAKKNQFVLFFRTHNSRYLDTKISALPTGFSVPKRDSRSKKAFIIAERQELATARKMIEEQGLKHQYNFEFITHKYQGMHMAPCGQILPHYRIVSQRAPVEVIQHCSSLCIVHPQRKQLLSDTIQVKSHNDRMTVQEMIDLLTAYKDW